jgi:hypothetical protein
VEGFVQKKQKKKKEKKARENANGASTWSACSAIETDPTATGRQAADWIRGHECRSTNSIDQYFDSSIHGSGAVDFISCALRS